MCFHVTVAVGGLSSSPMAILVQVSEDHGMPSHPVPAGSGTSGAASPRSAVIWVRHQSASGVSPRERWCR